MGLCHPGRGTLTAEERFKINDPIVQMIVMLFELPFPKHLKQVPEIANGHHEKMDGSGYPKWLKRDEMRMVMVAGANGARAPRMSSRGAASVSPIEAGLDPRPPNMGEKPVAPVHRLDSNPAILESTTRRSRCMTPVSSASMAPLP
ncbi:hypothetical protein CKO42_20890 [Lamprobacter modestohalophilus]|uniref:HD-GYP domain-containing protein n=1 Tax=Lamprobacter modestohalophilus TaxID=1064514 RepID=A0A9X0WCA9_9GAMM|nr:HD domain-containing phosphohydrolase [Lamprobacter modestohalophilus]MBK1620839.1 hypothetical protein [Lamprobacter modestohalophilus]